MNPTMRDINPRGSSSYPLAVEGAGMGSVLRLFTAKAMAAPKSRSTAEIM
jgi:hypothetical protein